jgi:hypothetical protein
MFQAVNPYTGKNQVITIGPNAYANLGLGDGTSDPTVDSDPTRQQLKTWIGEHPKLQTWVKKHPRVRKRLVRHALRGLGQDPGTDTATISFPWETGSPSVNPTGGYVVDTAGNVFNPSNPLNSLSTGGGFDFSSLINTLITQGGNIAKMELTPGGSYTSFNPQTGAYTSYQGTGTPSSLTSFGVPGSATLMSSPIVLLGIAAVVVVIIASKK